MATNLKKISSLNTIDPGNIGPEDLLYFIHKAPGQYISYNVKLEDLFVGTNAITSDMKFYSDTLTITDGKIGINDIEPEVELSISGSVTADGTIRYTKNENSTSVTTGTLRVVGGVGISENIYAGGIQATPIGGTTRSTGAFTTLTTNEATTFTAGIASTSSSTGTMIVTGGIGISGNIYGGGIQNTPIGNTTRNTGAFTTLTSNGATTFTSGVDSTSNTSGTLVVSGGTGITKNLTVGGDIRSYSSLSANYIYSYTDITAANTVYAENVVVNSITASSGVYVDSFLTANSIEDTPIGTITPSTGVFTTLLAIANTESTSSTTGTFKVTGGVGISGDIYAGGIQDTPIGNHVQSTGDFTDISATNLYIKNTVTADNLSANNTLSLWGVTVSSLPTMAAALMNYIYPVGSLYFNATSNANPAILLGFGVWELWGSGRVPVCVNVEDSLFNTVGKLGGSKDAVVVYHDHVGYTSTAGEHTHTFKNNENDAAGSGVADASSTEEFTITTSSAGAHSHTVTVEGTGDTGVNKNIQPYITCYMWKRTN